MRNMEIDETVYHSDNNILYYLLAIIVGVIIAVVLQTSFILLYKAFLFAWGNWVYVLATVLILLYLKVKLFSKKDVRNYGY